MPKKPANKAVKKKARKARKPTTTHVYREPKTAKELGVTCSECGADASWFDYGRATKDQRAGFVCDSHPAIGQREKLLVKDSAALVA